MASPSTPNIPQMAILDDNLSLSTPHFAHLTPTRVHITTFADTLPPFSHPSTSESDRAALICRLRPFSIISTMRERTAFPTDLLDHLPNLRLLLVTGVRHLPIDLADAKERGIVVAAALGYKPTGPEADQPTTPSRSPHTSPDLSNGAAHPTTQHTWALILGLARGVAREDTDMRLYGGWQRGLAVGLGGRILGVVGLGRLGGAVARVGAVGFGMRVVCWSTNLTQDGADGVAEKLGVPVVGRDGNKTFRVVGKEELFRIADVVTVHYTLGERSRGLVGREELGWMKQEAMLVNTSRGPLIDEQALIETLEQGRIRGAALDVFDVEPLPALHPFRSQEWGRQGRSELLLSPHLGYVERETLDTFYAQTAENLERWLDGMDLVNRMA